MGDIFGSIDMEPGIYQDIPFSDYLQIRAFSKSDIKHLNKSQNHFKIEKEKPKEVKEAFIIGDICDILLTDNKSLGNEYHMLPQFVEYQGRKIAWNGTLKTCKKIKEEAENKYPNKIIIPYSWYEEAYNCAEALKNFDMAIEPMQNAIYQETIVWIDEETGVKCKGRLDFRNDYCTTDIKTTKDASEKAFQNDLVKLDYGCQGAMYQYGLSQLTGEDIKPFAFLCVEKGTYMPVRYFLREESLAIGLDDARKAMLIYKECLESGKFKGYKSGDIDYPRWKLASHKDMTGLIPEDY